MHSLLPPQRNFYLDFFLYHNNPISICTFSLPQRPNFYLYSFIPSFTTTTTQFLSVLLCSQVSRVEVVGEVTLALEMFPALRTVVSLLHVRVCLEVSVQVAPPFVLHPAPHTLVLPHVGVDFGVGQHAILRREAFVTFLTSELAPLLPNYRHHTQFGFHLGFYVVLFLNSSRYGVIDFVDCGGWLCFNGILLDDLLRIGAVTPLQVVDKEHLLVEQIPALLTLVLHQVALLLLVAHQVAPILELHPALLALKLPFVGMHLPVLPVTRLGRKLLAAVFALMLLHPVMQ